MQGLVQVPGYGFALLAGVLGCAAAVMLGRSDRPPGWRLHRWGEMAPGDWDYARRAKVWRRRGSIAVGLAVCAGLLAAEFLACGYGLICVP